VEDSKKDKVLDVAMDLFRKKGYASASMQEIAEACGMAKASIYKIFDSKEDLFTAAFVACHRTLLEKVAELDRASRLLGLSPKEKLSRIIELQLAYSIENHLFTLDFKDLPIKDNENFRTAWQKKKKAMLVWNKAALLEAFGDSAEPYIWDAVAIYQGILSVYLNFVVQKVVSTPLAELATFIVDRMDAVARDLVRREPRPILNGKTAYFNALNPSDAEARHETALDFLRKLDETVRRLSLPDEAKDELSEVVGLLRKEISGEEANPAMIRVLAAYLDAVPELRADLRQLKFLLS